MSIRKQILDSIGSRLKNIKKTNGYNETILGTSIRRASLTPFKNGDLPAINYWPSKDTLENKLHGKESRVLSVTVEAYAVTRDLPFVDVALNLEDDIIVALFRDVSAPLVSDNQSHSLGGLVKSLTVLSATPIIGEGQSPWCGNILELEITYSIKLGQLNN